MVRPAVDRRRVQEEADGQGREARPTRTVGSCAAHCGLWAQPQRRASDDACCGEEDAAHPRPCLVSKFFFKSTLYHFRLYLINIV